MCKPSCTWQYLNQIRSKDKDAMRKAYLEAVEHMRFVIQLYREQLDNGRYFLHEHPANATSWRLDFVEELLNAPRYPEWWATNVSTVLRPSVDLSASTPSRNRLAS